MARFLIVIKIWIKILDHFGDLFGKQELSFLLQTKEGNSIDVTQGKIFSINCGVNLLATSMLEKLGNEDHIYCCLLTNQPKILKSIFQAN